MTALIIATLLLGFAFGFALGFMSCLALIRLILTDDNMLIRRDGIEP